MTDTLKLSPDESGYTAVSGNETLRVQLDGGAGRYRRDILGAAGTVTAQWTLTKLQYEYLNAFYRTRTAKGSLPFYCGLFLEYAAFQNYLCHFIPESFQLTSQVGLTYVVSAQLEVKPADTDEDYDNAIVDLYEDYEDDMLGILSLLSSLVNEHIAAI